MHEIIKIKANLEQAKKILQELNSVALTYVRAKVDERAMLDKTSKSLIDQLSMLYEPLPSLAQNIVYEGRRKVPARPETPTKKETVKIERISTASGSVYVATEGKDKFLEELNLSFKQLKEAKTKIFKKKKTEEKEEFEFGIKPSTLGAFSSKIFGEFASGLTKESLFKSVEIDLRKANMPFMLSTYIAIIFFWTFLTFFISLIIALTISFAMNAGLIEIVRNVALGIVLTVVVFLVVLTYPANIAGGNKRKIDNELPFAAAHMAAIASSKVEPSKIFAIMALTKEYKAFGAEIRKVLNQINVYGYDLTTALRNAAKTSPSKRLADLFGGMVTTITTGGNLTTYLQEKSKSLLIDYRLSHEKYTNVIGMYSDIYTALLIAAPLIFMLLLAIISIMGSTFLAMDITTLANLGIIIIAALNILFILFLKFTQPEV